MRTNWNLWFYIPFVFSLIIGGVMLSYVEKGSDVLFINGLHSPVLDNLFYYGTELGNGLLYLIVAIALSWKNLRHALMGLVCFSLTGIISQLLKKLVFQELMRPGFLLAEEPLHLVEGVKILKHFSFPSGHTAMAFSLFCLLAQLIPAKWIGSVFLLMALIGGVSRIYLVQHFFIDVYFGAILGVLVTSLVWLWFTNKSTFSYLDKKSISSYFNK